MKKLWFLIYSTLFLITGLSATAWSAQVRCELDGSYIARNNSGRDSGNRIKGVQTCGSEKKLRAFYSNGKKKFAYFRQVTTADNKVLWVAASGIQNVGPIAAVKPVQPAAVIQEPVAPVSALVPEHEVAGGKVDRPMVPPVIQPAAVAATEIPAEQAPKVDLPDQAEPLPKVDQQPVIEPASKPAVKADKGTVQGEHLIAPQDLSLYTLNSNNMGVSTGKVLEAGTRFKVVHLNNHNTEIRLANGQTHYVKRKELEKYFNKEVLASDEETDAVSGIDCRNNPNCPRKNQDYKANPISDLFGGVNLVDIDYRKCGLNADRKPKSNDALTALACNNYNEAGHESYDSMKAICKVVLGRLASPDYPKTVPELVYDKDQFSWVWWKPVVKYRKVVRYISQINGGLQPKPDNISANIRWNRSIKAAVDCLNEGPKMDGKIWTNYFAEYSAPKWKHSSNCTPPTRLVSSSKHLFLSCNGMPNGKGGPRAIIAKEKKQQAGSRGKS